MKLSDYLKQAEKDHTEELKVFVDRNKIYATDDDIFDNTKRIAEIARALGIEITAEDVEWVYFIGKLVRERRNHRDDNFIDAINYLRRIKMMR